MVSLFLKSAGRSIVVKSKITTYYLSKFNLVKNVNTLKMSISYFGGITFPAYLLELV